MIKTQFDESFREIPSDIEAYKAAQKKVLLDFEVAKNALEENPSELDQIDFFRLQSRVSDLERFVFQYQKAYQGFKSTEKFWTSIAWKKAAFLCELKGELCRGYMEEDSVELMEERFFSLLERLEDDKELQIYKLFYFQYLGQVFAFRSEKEKAKDAFEKGLLAAEGKKKQAQRFRSFLEKLESD